MIEINLLPVRIKKREVSAAQFITLFVVCLVVTLGAVGFLWFNQYTQVKSLQSELARINSEIKGLEKTERELNALKERKKLVEKKTEVVRNLKKDRDGMVRLLAVVSVQVPPEKLWFDKMECVGQSVSLTGVAVSNDAIVDFMRNLEASPYVQQYSVNLTQSRLVEMSKKKLRSFGMRFIYVPYSVVSIAKKLDMVTGGQQPQKPASSTTQ